VAAVAHKEFRSLSVQGLALKLKPQGVWVDVKAVYDLQALQAAGFTVWRL
jgi:UDP-N-acetyl-D-galactosamine dehydrogenase